MHSDHAPSDRSRRALLQGKLRARAPIRPPWALAEQAFASACTGCNACIRACVPRVLVRGAGGLPEFDARLGECSFCADCVRACGEPAFGSLDEAPWALRAQVDDACLTLRGVVCSSCRDACGESAIAFPLTRAVPRPLIDAERCSGCGACVPACLTMAVSLGVPVGEQSREA